MSKDTATLWSILVSMNKMEAQLVNSAKSATDTQNPQDDWLLDNTVCKNWFPEPGEQEKSELERESTL